MLAAEAKWLSSRIGSMAPEDIFPLCDVGSSTAEYREQVQPWIDSYIFRPIRERGGSVKHIDIKAAPGIDLVGDLSDSTFLKRLAGMEFRSVICANLLEQVTNREEIAAVIKGIVPPGGFLFITCPYRYPVHLDPIDTRYRPTVAELAGLFPGTTLVEGETVTNGTYWDAISGSPLTVVKTALRLLVPFYHYRNWITNINHLPWLRRHFQVTCVVLRKD